MMLAKRVGINMAGMKRKSRTRQTSGSLRRHKRSMVLISVVIFLVGVAAFAQGMSLRQKNEIYIAQEAGLQEQLDEEKLRSEEIDKLGDYIGTDAYIEDVAREKLGLIHENEIIFKPGQ